VVIFFVFLYIQQGLFTVVLYLRIFIPLVCQFHVFGYFRNLWIKSWIYVVLCCHAFAVIFLAVNPLNFLVKELINYLSVYLMPTWTSLMNCFSFNQTQIQMAWKKDYNIDLWLGWKAELFVANKYEGSFCSHYVNVSWCPCACGVRSFVMLSPAGGFNFVDFSVNILLSM